MSPQVQRRRHFVEIDGRERVVDLEIGPGDRVAWTIDGRRGEARFERFGDGRGLLVRDGSLQDGAGAMPIAVVRGPTGVQVQTRDAALECVVHEEGARLLARLRGAAGGSGVVKSSMPGQVVAVKAAEGDAVHAGQEIVILEAMKMENAVKAPRDGKLGRIGVRPGQAVESGALLFEIVEG